MSGEALAGTGAVLTAYRMDRYTAVLRVMPCPYLTCWDKPGHNLLQLLNLQTCPLSWSSQKNGVCYDKAQLHFKNFVSKGWKTAGPYINS